MSKKKKIIIISILIIIIIGLVVTILLLPKKGSNDSSKKDDTTNNSSNSSSTNSDIEITPEEPIASDLVDTQKLYMEAEVDYPLEEGIVATKPGFIPKTIYVSVPETFKEWSFENKKWISNNIPSGYTGFSLEPRYRDGGSGNTDYYKKIINNPNQPKYTISIGGTVGSYQDKFSKRLNN